MYNSILSIFCFSEFLEAHNKLLTSWRKLHLYFSKNSQYKVLSVCSVIIVYDECIICPTVLSRSVTSVIVTGTPPVGPKPAKMLCPVCHMDIKTTTVSENQAGAHIACIVLFLLG
jgi:hypothetical protein